MNTPIVARPLPFRAGEKWGYLDTGGRVLHEAQFDYAGDYNEGIGYARQGRSLLVLAEQFEIVGEVKDVEAYGMFHCGLLSVHKSDYSSSFYIDRGARNAFGKEFSSAHAFTSDRAFAQVGDSVDGLYGMLDLTGRWVVEPAFCFGHKFRPGERITSVALTKNGAWRLIDTDGQYVCAKEFDQLGFIAEGLVPFGRKQADRRMLMGVADARGEELVPPLFEYCDPAYSENLLGVETADGTWGVVDRSGHWVIHPQYTYIGECKNGLLLAYKGGRQDPNNRGLLDGKYGFVRPDGSVAIDFQFDVADPFDGGVASVEWFRNIEGFNYDVERGYVGLDGRIIWREQKDA